MGQFLIAVGAGFPDLRFTVEDQAQDGDTVGGGSGGEARGAAGLDPARYAGHSLRAGLATAAAIAGAEERATMRQTRHRSERMVRKYIRDGQLFRDNAAATVGLRPRGNRRTPHLADEATSST